MLLFTMIISQFQEFLDALHLSVDRTAKSCTTVHCELKAMDHRVRQLKVANPANFSSSVVSPEFLGEGEFCTTTSTHAVSARVFTHEMLTHRSGDLIL